MLEDIEKGKIQLPDFQRGWVWDDNRIKGLIASVIKSFPISVVTLLETGENVAFKTKPVEGATTHNGVKPEFLILDGQQRLTSLYQAIVTNKVVKTRNSKGYEIFRWYYIDMKKATAIVMGTEATGLTQQWRKAADKHIRIPMCGKLDSLNVSVSSAILMFEAIRQRR